jgi:uncharacterized membrane protein YjjB (DUF3815 family)
MIKLIVLTSKRRRAWWILGGLGYSGYVFYVVEVFVE